MDKGQISPNEGVALVVLQFGNTLSAAEIVTTLSSAGIDCSNKWKSMRISLDRMRKRGLIQGTLCHHKGLSGKIQPMWLYSIAPEGEKKLAEFRQEISAILQLEQKMRRKKKSKR